MDNKLKSIKMQISKLSNIKDLYELSKYAKKRINIIRKRDWDQKVKNKIKRISALPIGTKVAVTDHNWPEFCGRVGIITKHPGKGSSNSYIDFDGQLYRVPRMHLTDDISEENLKELRTKRQLTMGVRKIFSNLEK